MVFSLTACAHEGFYLKMKQSKSIYKDFFKYEGNKESLKLLDKDLEQSKEIIIIGGYSYPLSYDLIYDCTNDVYYYIEKNQNDNQILYRKLKKEDLINDSINYDDMIFALNYVLDNKINELLEISIEAYDDNSGSFTVVKIINIEKQTYKEFSFKSILTFKGMPVITKEEYLKAMGW